ncbi:MAG: hypothetical protein HYV14_10500 [Elusimicrobia bacterium]|nr:hypothetical protein [Elusimicrobiota bacterium]
MKRTIACRVVLVAILGLACPPAFSAKVKAVSPQTMFRDRMSRIEKKVVDLTAPSDLFRSPDFLQVYKDPKTYVEDSLEFLKSPDVSDTRKLIAAYSMQRLKTPDYLKFLDGVLGLLKTEKVSPNVFQTAAFPTLEWNTTLQENYKDPAVIAFLKKAKTVVKSDEDRKYIDRILSGAAAQDVEDMRDMEAPRPKAP